MRFLLKIGFWLALIAFFLPSFGGEEADREGVNTLGAFVGVQQALADLGGFCERAPAACAAGRDVGSYMAARVGDGLAYGYAAVRGGDLPPAEPAAPASSLPPVASPARSAPPAGGRPAPWTPPVRAAAEPAAAPARGPASSAVAAAVAPRTASRESAALAPFAMPLMEEKAVRARTPAPARFVHAGNASAIPRPTPRP